MRPSAKLLTVREVADRLGLKESTIRKRILTAGFRPVVAPCEHLT